MPSCEAGYFGVPKIRALFEATYFAGLQGGDAGGVNATLRLAALAAGEHHAPPAEVTVNLVGRCATQRGRS
jgi:hypothetical protein